MSESTRPNRSRRLSVATETVDPYRVSPAGVYDYLLGGGYNFARDRAAADHVLRAVPHARSWACASRSFLRRAMRHVLDAGVTQFLDLGCGLPSVAATHEIAHEVDPACRVVYVDTDPVVVECIRLHAGSDARVGVIHADLCDVDTVLRDPVATSLLDFRQPVGLFLGAVLHHIADSDAAASAVAGYYERLAAGSVLAASHVTANGLAIEQQQRIAELFSGFGITLVARSRAEFLRLLGPWKTAADGAVPLSWWRPESPHADRPYSRLGYAVLARKPHAAAKPVGAALTLAGQP